MIEKILAEGAEFWACVEVVGRRTYYGKVTVESLGGAAFFRVDTPEKPGSSHEETGFFCLPGESANSWGRYRIHEAPVRGESVLVGTGSIYQITPMPEVTVREQHYRRVSGERVGIERIEIVSALIDEGDDKGYDEGDDKGDDKGDDNTASDDTPF